MSTARRFALILTLAAATVATSAASVFAQAGAPNPSGGTTGCRQGIEEGAGSIGLSDFLKGLSIDLGASGWISGFAMSRFVVPAAHRRASGRALTAVEPRRLRAR